MNTVTLRNVSRYTSRGISPKYIESDGLLVLNQKCIRNQKIDLGPARLTDSSKKFNDEKRLRKFDILINSTGVGTLGRIAQLKFDLDATVDSHVTIFRPAEITPDGKSKLDPLFIGYSVRSQEEFIESLGAGATGQTELSKDSILDGVVIQLPDYKIQAGIGLALSAYDDLIENNEKRIKILEETTERLYREWFVNFKFAGHKKVKLVESGTEYGKIPEGWGVKRLNDLCEYIGRGVSPKYDEESQNIVLNQKCVRGHRVSFDSSRRQSKKVSAEKLIKFGDVLICSTGVGTLGRVAQIYDNYKNCTADSHVSIVRAGNDVNIDYLGLVMLSKERSFTEQGKGSTGQTELSRDAIQETKMLYPPLELQKLFSEKVTSSRKIVINLAYRSVLLSQARDLLIPQLVTGRREFKIL